MDNLFIAEISNEGNISKIYEEEFDDDLGLIVQTELNNDDNEIYTSNIYEKGFFKLEINLNEFDNKLKEESNENYETYKNFIKTFENYFLLKSDTNYIKLADDTEDDDTEAGNTEADYNNLLSTSYNNLVFLIPNKIFYDSEKDSENDFIINFINSKDKEYDLKLSSDQKKNIYINLIKITNSLINIDSYDNLYKNLLSFNIDEKQFDSINIPLNFKILFKKLKETSENTDEHKDLHKQIIKVLTKEIYCIDIKTGGNLTETEFIKVIDIDCKKVTDTIVDKAYGFVLNLGPNKLYLLIGLIILIIIGIVFMLKSRSDDYEDEYDDYY